MLRTTILRHEPDPEGPQPHFDWLLEAAPGTLDDDRIVPTFRCSRRPDRLAIGESTRLQAIDPHRGWWLSREVFEEVTMTPPSGKARVIQSGILDSGPSSPFSSMESTVRWSQSVMTMTYRLESRGSGPVLVTRIAPFSSTDESSLSPVNGIPLL
jgi:hypothetical protein